jgi:hypothetical protein
MTSKTYPYLVSWGFVQEKRNHMESENGRIRGKALPSFEKEYGG